MPVIAPANGGIYSEVFNESTKIEGGLPLRDPTALRECYIFTELSRLPRDKKKEFCQSREARAMMEEGYLSADSLQQLVQQTMGQADPGREYMVCHMAAEIGDERWDELVRTRARERELLNSMMQDYGAKADSCCDEYRQECIDKIPKEYRPAP